MHPSSLENMRACHDRYLLPNRLRLPERLTVLDIGGADVNGSYRPIFASPNCDYLTADIAADAAVDIVLTDPYSIPMPDASVDVVLSGQMLEHCAFFWRAFQEMVRLMQPNGFIFLIAPSAGPIHRYPVDCYRFYPDAYAALAELTGCHLQDVWRDERGPWHDLVGVFRHGPLTDASAKAQSPAPAGTDAVASAATPLGPMTQDRAGADLPPPPDAERVAGQADYLDVLAEIHGLLQPRRYLEIGVRHGRSLALAQCPAIGIDPEPAISVDLPPATRVMQMSSDLFFEQHPRGLAKASPDLVFIDGMHLFEYALRDFIHVERLSAAYTVVVIDDIYPNHPRQAVRDRVTRVWTGDVWKLHACLREARPDLLLLALDTRPTGLLLIAGLDPNNRVLSEDYETLTSRYLSTDFPHPPAAIIQRVDALNPTIGQLKPLLRLIVTLRTHPVAPGQLRWLLRDTLERSLTHASARPLDPGSR